MERGKTRLAYNGGALARHAASIPDAILRAEQTVYVETEAIECWE